MNHEITHAMQGAHDALHESEKQFRSTGDAGHANLCQAQRQVLAALLPQINNEAAVPPVRRDDSSSIPPVLAGAPVVRGHYWLIDHGVSSLHCVYSGRRQFAGQLVVVTRGISHTRSSVEEAPVTQLDGVWFGPLKPPRSPDLKSDGGGE